MAGTRSDLNGAATIVDAGDIDEIVFGSFRGRQSMVVTLGGTAYGPLRVGDIDVLTGEGAVKLRDAAPDELLKAGWNWNLVNNDGTYGVHNPRYALTVLAAARDAVNPGGGGPRILIEDVFPSF